MSVYEWFALLNAHARFVWLGLLGVLGLLGLLSLRGLLSWLAGERCLRALGCLGKPIRANNRTCIITSW